MNVYRPVPLVAADTVWIARCPVPTLTGLALGAGHLHEGFGEAGLKVRALRDEPNPFFQEQGYYHDLKHLFREGGNYPAIAGRAEGNDKTVIVALTWVDEAQFLLARPGSGIANGDLARLTQKRFGLSLTTGRRDIWRAMALRGYDTALRLGGISLADAELIDLPTGSNTSAGTWSKVSENALLSGEVDVIYAKGAPAVALQQKHNLDIVLDVNQVKNPLYRINNGTPRPITVHRHLLDDRPELVVRFLSILLQTEGWARKNAENVIDIVARETATAPEGVQRGYGPRLAENFTISLDDTRISALQNQADFLHRHGLVSAGLDVNAWIDPLPLRLATQKVENEPWEVAKDMQKPLSDGALRVVGV